MQSKRDQVQAYFFVVGRLVSAVVHGKPDALVQPNRRMSNGTFLGAIVGAVLMGIFGIIGLVQPGGDTSWRQEGAIVLSKDTRARYVYLENQLRPVLNYSSARLAAPKGGGQVHDVAQKSLAGTLVGQQIGIQGAPDALPPAGALDKGPWTECAQEAGSGPQGAGAVTTVVIGQPSSQTVRPDSRALLVRAPDQTVFLVWQGQRHRLPGPTADTALNYRGIAPVDVTAAWLNPIPQGRDFSVPETPGIGQPGPRIDGAQSVVGRLYQVSNPALGTEEFYLIRTDGIAPLSRTTAALLLASPFTRQAYGGSEVRPIEVGPGDLVGVPVSRSGPDLVRDLPPTPPDIVSPGPGETPCEVFQPVGNGGLTVYTGLLPAAIHQEAVPAAAHQQGGTADRVLIPAGDGVLARTQATPGGPAGALYLITETGMKYPLANADAVDALGYSAATAVAMPGELLALLPTGPVLSTESALGGPAPAQ